MTCFRKAVPLVLTLCAALMAQTACATAPVASSAAPTSKISRDPFFAGLVTRARRLESETKAFTPALDLLQQPKFKIYTQAIRNLSADDQKGHMTLKARGTDNDLKCIMKGLSLDLNIKMDAILTAKSDAEVGTALNNMAALLRDHIDVIVTPATADSGLDCVIEFGNT
ncbi:hypothetical protein [Asticcacaulis benevestitus]|uniref:Uncharacterized protein n=1 Tax=Asticcacaulis benevestitus DSM 16100 = ATCC BAA-896 TaxID=1121022 RepID=V4NXT6_9CAUL|nr:hypothetical protein [Asticcacaulis benevestitus]ESQ86557.1 hypothetical protein ABENE_18265 [Asticcacaulis benevestitus DSM 16100 = ATCC BAA-896]